MNTSIVPGMPEALVSFVPTTPTSGSTGTPRLVTVSHGNLAVNTEGIIRTQNLGSHEREMLIMPISYCLDASVMHTHLYQGGRVVFDSCHAD